MREALPAPQIPETIEELTPSWITAALRAGGRLADARVVRVDPEPLGAGEGFVGQVVRLRLSYDGSPRAAPESVIAKLPIRVDSNRQIGEVLGAYEREIRFYTELAESVPIPKPACYHAAMDPGPVEGKEKETLEFLDRLPTFVVRVLMPLGMWLAGRSRRRYVLLLEDLAPRRPGDQVAGCSVDEAAGVIAGIARVHAAWWQRSELAEMPWIAPVWVLRRYAHVMYRSGHRAFFEHFGDGLPDGLRELAAWLRGAGIPLMESFRASPFTLLHGDYRLDNLFFDDESADAPIVAFDWQNVSLGPGALDVAYFISGNLSRELAREHEDELLRGYHEALQGLGVSGYDLAACRRDYQRSMLLIAYRMISGMHLMDWTNERGTALIRGWLDRIAPLIPADRDELVRL